MPNTQTSGMPAIAVAKTAAPKQKPADEGKLGFGNIFTDHMFAMDYSGAKGWHDPRIVPYGDICMSPAAMVLHYGQATFEGLKAYKAKNGGIQLFRPRKNFERMNWSNERLCMPTLDIDFALEALKKLIRLEADWIPTAPGTSLYIRPLVFATDPYIGVRASDTYLFMIILSPVGAYYPEGLNPVKIFVENEYVRAVRGGIGFAKAAANYAASLKAQYKAKDLGYTQVLWLDGVERKYIEEVGTMNIFFKIAGKIVTPALNGSILPGITRDSTIALLGESGLEVEERLISIDEVYAAYKSGALEEAFGTGTAAVVSPIGELIYGDSRMELSDGQIGPVSKALYDRITQIQYGDASDDPYSWIEKV